MIDGHRERVTGGGLSTAAIAMRELLTKIFSKLELKWLENVYYQ
jgi:hypothetical protein